MALHKSCPGASNYQTKAQLGDRGTFSLSLLQLLVFAPATLCPSVSSLLLLQLPPPLLFEALCLFLPLRPCSQSTHPPHRGAGGRAGSAMGQRKSGKNLRNDAPRRVSDACGASVIWSEPSLSSAQRAYHTRRTPQCTCTRRTWAFEFACA